MSENGEQLQGENVAEGPADPLAKSPHPLAINDGGRLGSAPQSPPPGPTPEQVREHREAAARAAASNGRPPGAEISLVALADGLAELRTQQRAHLMIAGGALAFALIAIVLAARGLRGLEVAAE